MMVKEDLITNSSLNEFFYKKLSRKNKEVACPLPEEFIFYSSLVLERYALSDVFFTSESGKMNEKILGVKLLETLNKETENKVTDLKDIGDTVLVQLGLFSGSVKKKLTTKTYYLTVAQNAYHELDGLNSQFYDIPNFYKLFATSLDKTVSLLGIMADEFNQIGLENYLLELPTPHKKAI